MTDHRAAVRPAARAATLVVAMIVAGCGGSSATTGPGSAAASLPGTSLPGSSLPGALPSFNESTDLAATLPTSVNGVQLAVLSGSALQAYYAVPGGQLNNLTLLIVGAGAHPAQVNVAVAADSGGAIQIAAAQFTGVSTADIQASVEALAKQADPTVALKQETMGGKQVTTATYSGSTLQPIVAYVTGDTVYLVKGSDPTTVEDAVRQLP